MDKTTSPNFVNRTMWTRDNLDVLRGLNSASVDLVYADPPFNSNRNYEAPIGSKAAGAAFKDTWALSDVDLAWHGEIAEREPRVYAAIDAAGIVHGKGMRSYLTMMAVRLLELRRVLKPTGSLYRGKVQSGPADQTAEERRCQPEHLHNAARAPRSRRPTQTSRTIRRDGAPHGRDSPSSTNPRTRATGCTSSANRAWKKAENDDEPSNHNRTTATGRSLRPNGAWLKPIRQPNS